MRWLAIRQLSQDTHSSCSQPAGPRPAGAADACFFKIMDQASQQAVQLRPLTCSHPMNKSSASSWVMGWPLNEVRGTGSGTCVSKGGRNEWELSLGPNNSSLQWQQMCGVRARTRAPKCQSYSAITIQLPATHEPPETAAAFQECAPWLRQRAPGLPTAHHGYVGAQAEAVVLLDDAQRELLQLLALVRGDAAVGADLGEAERQGAGRQEAAKIRLR